MLVRPRVVRVTRRPEQVLHPGEPWPDVRRLLVVRHDRLGDLVLTLPALAALRRTYPEARLALAVAPALRPLAGIVDGVDEVLAAGDEEALRRFAPDLAVCISRSPGLAWALRRAGVGRRVGPGRRFYSPLFRRRVAERRRGGGRHEVEYALSFAHRAGAPGGPADFPLRPPGEAAAETAEWLARQGIATAFVALHPGSGGSCPRWPGAHFRRLAEMLTAERVPVVVTCGPGDEPVVEGLAGRPCFSGDLPRLAALLDQAALVVGSSTGPIHLAAALGTPALALHAPWASCGVERWGPYADNGWGLVADNAEARGWSRRRRRSLSGALMEALPPGAVIGCVRRMLDGEPPGVDV